MNRRFFSEISVTPFCLLGEESLCQIDCYGVLELESFRRFLPTTFGWLGTTPVDFSPRIALVEVWFLLGKPPCRVLNKHFEFLSVLAMTLAVRRSFRLLL